MARKAQRAWEQVSSLVGRIEFSVSGKGWTDKNGRKYADIPRTDGFIVEVTYESESDKTYHALCNSVVAVQSTLKRFYWDNGRFPVQPGKLFKARSDGGMDLPNTVMQDRVEKQILAGEMPRETMIRYARALGLEIPAEWLAAEVAATAQAEQIAQADLTATQDQGKKYTREALAKMSRGRLGVLAINEGVEHNGKSSSELVAILAEIPK